MKRAVLGFTGSRDGMTDAQAEKVIELIRQIDPAQTIDGCCVGSDAQFFKIVKHDGIPTTGMPGHYKDHPNDKSKVDPELRDVMVPSKPHMQRNRAIVNDADVMIATPPGTDFNMRGGTNSTIKYAIKQEVPIFIVLPDGTVINDINNLQTTLV